MSSSHHGGGCETTIHDIRSGQNATHSNSSAKVDLQNVNHLGLSSSTFTQGSNGGIDEGNEKNGEDGELEREKLDKEENDKI